MDNTAQVIIWKLGNVDFVIRGGKIVWQDKIISQPTQIELAQWSQEYQSFLKANSYKEKRISGYLPMSEYMDAKAKQTSSDPVIVAEGVQQEADFHAGNLAVKAKYPKPV